MFLSGTRGTPASERRRITLFLPRPRDKCHTPRLQGACDLLAMVPQTERRVVVDAVSPAAAPRAKGPQCRDGATHGGMWVKFSKAGADDERKGGAGYGGSPWATLVERSVHRDDPKMAPWRFARPSCDYHFFAPDEGAACLEDVFVVYVGDSLVRGLYATTVRLLGGATSDDRIKAAQEPSAAKRGGGKKKAAVDPASQTAFAVGRARLAYVNMWGDAELPTVKKALAREVAKRPFRRLVVVANWGAEHSVAAACDAVEAKFGSQATSALRAVRQVAGPKRPLSLVLATPTALLARRNPGMSTTKALQVAAVLERQAATAPNAGLADDARVLDLANLTLARFDDATLDGVHYGQTAATMGATVLLNMLCARPGAADTTGTPT